MQDSSSEMASGSHLKWFHLWQLSLWAVSPICMFQVTYINRLGRVGKAE